MHAPNDTAAIRQLNDTLRQLFTTSPQLIPGPFRILITRGVGELSEDDFATLISKVTAGRLHARQRPAR